MRASEILDAVCGSRSWFKPHSQQTGLLQDTAVWSAGITTCQPALPTSQTTV